MIGQSINTNNIFIPQELNKIGIWVKRRVPVGDSYDDMKSYAKKLGYSFHYALDVQSEMADAFGATRTPECFLFDKDGKLVYHGAIDDNANAANSSTPYLNKAISNLVGGKKIDPEKTRSVGCTIKRQS